MPLTKVTKGVSQGLASLDGNGEVVEKPAGAGAALATDVLRADGTFGAAGLGVGQTWQDMTASRAFLTTYTNSTGRPITVSVTGVGSPNHNTMGFTINGVVIARQGFASSSNLSGDATVIYIIPNGSTYEAHNIIGSSMSRWWELR